MRKIKFRGKDADGVIRYGAYSDIVVGGKLICEIMDDYRDIYEVVPESVAQFVGYDKNGKEIYSDDKVIDADGIEVFFKDLIIHFFEIGGKFCGLRLKNENEN